MKYSVRYFSDHLYVYICDECKTMVLPPDKDGHTNWHGAIAMMIQQAYDKAEHADSWMRPIG